MGKNKLWEPQNYDEKYLGPVTLRKALTLSRNVVTIKILQDIGINYAVTYARQFGIDTPLNKDLTLALGTPTLTLLQMVRAFGVFCAHGVRVQPIAITRIMDRDNNLVEENTPLLYQALNPPNRIPDDQSAAERRRRGNREKSFRAQPPVRRKNRNNQ